MAVTRRALLAATTGTLALPRVVLAQNTARIVVIGGGFGGVTFARTIRRIAPRSLVKLIEPNLVFTSCPFSNEVLVGLRDIAEQRFDYDEVVKAGITLVRSAAIGIDHTARKVTLADGATHSYDRLLLSPGIDIAFGTLEGYDEYASGNMPHAWQAVAQTVLLQKQLEAMGDGGTVIISAPAYSYSCPSAPYERASLIAHYLKTRKPKSKLLLLDAKDAFPMQRLFQEAWGKLYPNLLEWVPASAGGAVVSVDSDNRTFTTRSGAHKADVANVIPPQRAARIATLAGVADQTGWCPVDPVTFESRLVPNIHVIGDAAMAGAMPKSAFSASAQAKICAYAVAAALAGGLPAEPRLLDTSYSLVAPGYGISEAGVYRPSNGVLAGIEGAGGTSPLNASAEFRALEAEDAETWFKTITNEVFG